MISSFCSVSSTYSKICSCQLSKLPTLSSHFVQRTTSPVSEKTRLVSVCADKILELSDLLLMASTTPKRLLPFLRLKSGAASKCSGKWFPGKIIESHMKVASLVGTRRVLHHVAYADGDDQWHKLEGEKEEDPRRFHFHWLDDTTSAPEDGCNRKSKEGGRAGGIATVMMTGNGRNKRGSAKRVGGGGSSDKCHKKEPGAGSASTSDGKAAAPEFHSAATTKSCKAQGKHPRRRDRRKDCTGGSIFADAATITEHLQFTPAVAKTRVNMNLCHHKRRWERCKDCGGSSICELQQKRRDCKACGGSGICEHQRQRSACIDCCGSSICEHQRQRSQCKDCGGSSICEHHGQSSKCKD